MQFGQSNFQERLSESAFPESDEFHFRDTWLPAHCFQVRTQTDALAQDLSSLLGKVSQAIALLNSQRELLCANAALDNLADLWWQRAAIEAAADGIAVFDAKGAFRYANPAYLRQFGYPPDETLSRQTWQQFYIPSEVRRFQLEIWPSLSRQPQWRGEAIALRPDGTTFPQEISLTRIADSHLVCICRDISDRKRAEAALREAEARYRSIFENAIEGIFQTTPEGRYLNVNPALVRIYGFKSPEDLIANIHSIQHQIYVDPNRRSEFIRLMQEHGRVSNFESLIYRRDGTPIWISENAHCVYNSRGDLLYYEGTVEDITTRKQSEEQLFLNAFHDSLTSLPNRALFMNRLKTALNALPRRPGHQFAVLFVDLDRFKQVNDSLGHLLGDQLLIQVSQRLQDCVRGGDTVARLGGDEFAILLEDIQSADDAIHVAERIQEQLGWAFCLQGHQVHISASVGIALSHHRETGQPYQNLEDLLRDADIAMYRAKHRGKACHELFDGTRQTQVFTQVQLEADLRRALDQQELELHYQPIVALQSRRVRGFEVLMRWQHPTQGLVPPGKFIDIATETGLILMLEEWVLRQACQQMQQWQRQGLADGSMTMSVNLTEKQFVQPKLIGQVGRILSETGLRPNCLRLEFAEALLRADIEAIAQNLYGLTDLGVQLCIDDFGMGFLSLSQLHSLPIHSVKIDRSFIHQAGISVESQAIVKTILSLAETLRMSVIAEGVETLEQLVQLMAMGCEYGQGYLFSSPVDRAMAESLLLKKQL
ncbi:EAL domain-containing protein [Thermoleptolyngbya sichuanensis A183]|uniref:EAL domain-containing protein n=1 Tax=Thermoleptolyngbya sichuanensis A183 TaxID=2737172 RepID=A0A6M8BCS1_9CYAN|nr:MULTISPECIES: bifunctional diguanylate cyclase/phosphodiesterase [Thermoleptolyngbya]QKD81073.1 EAL domain-containing protein [Thermoleptolyngbya sichuanensis A183]